MSKKNQNAVSAYNNVHVNYKNLVGFALTIWENARGTHHFWSCQNEEFSVWVKLKVPVSPYQEPNGLENIQSAFYYN